jgi:ATP-dependent DNA helicase RecG
MQEQQNIEWKENWRDEYLKWICGFANAQGGKIEIGKNDKGEVVGIDNAKRLMDDLPNKIVTNLGIICDINLLSDNDKQFIEITVESYPNPVNYKGQYHYRSGSTKQELKGVALDKFLLQRYGKTWDSVPFPRITVNDLDENAFKIFRKKGKNSGRVDDEVLNDSNLSILENLDLIENDYITRAGILLFHPKPDKFFTGSFIKIGFFTTDDDLRFQDEIHGNVFEQIERTLDLVKTKYLKAEIRYEGASRIEEFPFPPPAFREALLNAIAHKDYCSTTPIQISVYENKMIIWNQGQLPENWTVDKLTVNHPSVPYNPKISNALFRCGYVEAWGRGTINMINECLKRNIPVPTYKYDFSGFIVEFMSDLDKAIKTLNGANKGVIEGVKKVINKGVSDGVIDGISDGVKEEIASIVYLIANNEGINANNIVAKTGNKSKPSVERYLKIAKNLEIIEFKGAAKTGGYYLTGKIKSDVR